MKVINPFVYICLSLVMAFSEPAISKTNNKEVVIAHNIKEPLEKYYDYGILTEIFKRAGFRLRVEMVPWARGLLMMKEGQVDGMCNVLKTPEREAFMVFPKEVFVTYRQYIYTNAGSAAEFNGDIRSLKGKRIGIISGFSYGKEFDGMVLAGEITAEPVNTTMQNVQKLFANRIDLIVENDFAMSSAAENDPSILKSIRRLEPPLTSQPAYIAFSRKSPRNEELVAAYDKALVEMRKDGSYDRLLKPFLRE